MDEKHDVTYIEEQSTYEGDRTKTRLLSSDGIILIPQPTADPKGESLSCYPVNTCCG